MNTSIKNIKKSFGQGMTEYIIIVALVAVAAIGAFKMFGQTAQHQVAGLAMELAGDNGNTSKDHALTQAKQAQAQAGLNRSLSSYNGGNDAGSTLSGD
ncbi:MAG TPA: pilus assembly protein [Gammaproteobacteria bacterium]|nr:pilus assembly protein [Pseudomonadota bacterium]HBF09651.1 pilus assembly protein [Gammaproteobacteria bacterium]HCK91449.1 pilus assembly protein [Gammaproteobacteria bacterium]|tara:strand:+ start:886 stop:1179 length:294 start_codon:yes stop_codon:yes gene_type:complete